VSIGTVGQAVRLISTANMSREEWLRVRSQGIGGSEIAAIAGVSPWETPLSVYLRKVGELPEREETDAMRWGTLLEPLIADEYRRRHPEASVRRGNAVLRHPEVPYFLANIDREIRTKGAPPAVLEIKTASAWMGGRWRDDVPDHVVTQAQWYLSITGYTKAVVAVLIGGQEYREFEIARDEDIIGYLHEIGRRFWEEHVIPRIPPAVEAADLSTVERMHPESNGEVIDLPPTALSLLQEYEAAKEAEKEAQARREKAEAELKALLGDYEAGYAGDRLVKWATVSTSRIDTKRLKAEHPDIYERYVTTSTYRRFSVN